MVPPDSPHPTPALELVCLAIVALYVAVRAPRDPNPRAFLLRLATLMGASWLAEDTCIRAYGFYHYHPDWSLFVDQVPILIVLIWPMVIHTAWDLARHLTTSAARVPWIGAAIVLADASLIEPIAVRAGLWHWTEPGLFAVPPIGILGWAFFTFLALSVWSRGPAAEPLRPHAAPRPSTLAWTFPVTAVGVHLMLLTLWWGALRWMNQEVPTLPFVVVAWVASLSLSLWAARRRAGRQIPRVDLAMRIPAAAFFFVLLARYAANDPALIAYALAFAPPYLVLTVHSFGVSPTPR